MLPKLVFRRRVPALAALLAIAGAAQARPTGANLSPGATPLRQLIAEAERANPGLAAQRQSWQAARTVPTQVSTLPDPQLTVQEFSVGNPLPFAGYRTSDFAYTGIGVSQELPFPGKLHWRGEEARHEAAARGHEAEAARRALDEQVKEAYFNVAAVRARLAALDRDGALLRQVEEVTEARYRLGLGRQADVLKAQLAETALLRERAEEQERQELLEAQLKQIVNRPPQSPEIVPEPLRASPLPESLGQLLAAADHADAEIAAESETVRGADAAVQLARKAFDPDFSVAYMYQRTGPGFRDYYMLTVNIGLPLHRRGRLRPALRESILRRGAARDELEAGRREAAFAVQRAYLMARTDAQVLRLYQQGLMPQAQATLQAGLAAYRQGRGDFPSLMQSFSELLALDQQYWQTLAEHEIALAEIGRITGLALPATGGAQ